MSDHNELITKIFYDLLEAHGIPASYHNGWATNNGDFPCFRGFYTAPPNESSVGELIIQILLDENALIEESLAAFGDTPKAAIADAIEQFCICMFHPIIAACCGIVDENQITKEKWKTGPLSSADIWSGNIAMRKPDDVPVDISTDWPERIAKAFQQSELNKGYNWMTLYGSRLRDNPLTASASLNNNKWPEGLAATENMDWPQIDAFYGARLFVLART